MGPDLEGEEAQIIDARGFIVMPGFVDTHRHMWQGQLRRMIPNVDISRYLGLRNAFAAEYRPEDSYAGTLVTVYSGITTVQDDAHNTRSADHADAEIEALTRAGSGRSMPALPLKQVNRIGNGPATSPGSARFWRETHWSVSGWGRGASPISTT